MKENKKNKTVFDKNTYYFKNFEFEKKTQNDIENIIQEVIELQNKIKVYGCTKDLIDNFLKKENGLKILLTLTAISFETLKRIITIVRITDNQDLNNFFHKDKWLDCDYDKEWSSNKIKKMLLDNDYFRKSIVNFFFDGHKNDAIISILPEFEWRKLNSINLDNISNLSAQTIDILIRYSEKGGYVGRKENNPESLMKSILEEHNIPYETGDLPILIKEEITRKRTMDFIIPNKSNPKLIMEFTYVKTTSSGWGDKAKAENGIKDLIKKYYPESKFVGFIDGVGWIVRNKDCERMCEAFDDVFTFHENELERFLLYLQKILPEYF